MPAPICRIGFEYEKTDGMAMRVGEEVALVVGVRVEGDASAVVAPWVIVQHKHCSWVVRVVDVSSTGFG